MFLSLTPLFTQLVQHKTHTSQLSVDTRIEENLDIENNCRVWTPLGNFGNKRLVLEFPIFRHGNTLPSLHNYSP